MEGALHLAYSRSGRQAQAEVLLQELRVQPDDGRSRLNLGLADAMQGGTDTAIALLARAEWRLASLINLRADPLLAPLRADPGYGRLLGRLGVPNGSR